MFLTTPYTKWGRGTQEKGVGAIGTSKNIHTHTHAHSLRMPYPHYKSTHIPNVVYNPSVYAKDNTHRYFACVPFECAPCSILRKKNIWSDFLTRRIEPTEKKLRVSKYTWVMTLLQEASVSWFSLYSVPLRMPRHPSITQRRHGHL